MVSVFVPFTAAAIVVTLYGAYRTARVYEYYTPTLGWLIMAGGMVLILLSYLLSLSPPNAFGFVAAGALVILAGGFVTLYAVLSVAADVDMTVEEE